MSELENGRKTVYSADAHLSYSNMTALIRGGVIKLGIEDSLSTVISSNSNLKPNKSTAAAAFHFWNWIGLIGLIYSIYLSVTDQWWYFILGFIVWQVIWRANKKGNSENLLDVAMVDKQFYEKILSLDGWFYLMSEESYPRVMQMTNEVISDAQRINRLDDSSLSTEDCISFLRKSGFSVSKENDLYLIEFEAAYLEIDENQLLHSCNKLAAIISSGGTSIDSSIFYST